MVTELLNRPSEPARRAQRTRSEERYAPSVDIGELPNELLVTADLPGAAGKDIDVNFENGRLTLHGRVSSRYPENARVVAQEYGVGDFHRVFEISETIDAEKITAEYRNGVLTLHLPKVPAVQPRKIDVRTA